MKKGLIIGMVVACLVMLMMGAEFRQSADRENKNGSICSGYTIIEADKGVDCHGDTVNLIKNHGFYELKISPVKEFRTDVKKLETAKSFILQGISTFAKKIYM